MAFISIPTSIGGVALPGKLGSLASGPLAALFGSKALTQLNYPTELATDATKSHYVTFNIKEVVAAQYSTANQGANLAIPGQQTAAAGAEGAGVIYNAINDVTGGGATSAMDTINAKMNGALSNSPTVQSAVSNIGADFTGAFNKVVPLLKSAGKTGIAITSPVTKSKAIISLYMPDTLEAHYQEHYAEIGLRDALGSHINTLRAIDSIAGTVGASGAKDTKSVLGSISTDPNAIKMALDVVTGNKLVGAGKDLSDILLQGQGYTINPQMQMIYRGLEMRSFQLSFVFTPKSQKEAKNVNEIIHLFKYHAAPSLTSGATSSSASMFLTPPSIFNVGFFVGPVENKFLPKYADCVLMDIAVNTAPNGFAAHTDGAPVQTTLSLQFKEIEIADRGRLQTGFYSPDDPKGLR